MEIVKKHLVSIICGAVALLAVVLAFFPMGGFFTDLRTKVAESEADYNTIKGLRAQRFKLPPLDPQNAESPDLEGFPTPRTIEWGKDMVKRMREQSMAMLGRSLKMNEKAPLTPGVLPVATGGPRLFAFKSAYYDRLMELRASMNATTPPSPMDIQEAQDKVWKAKYQTIVDSGVRAEADVKAEFEANEAPKIPERLKRERAAQHTIYVSEVFNPSASANPMMSTGGPSINGLDVHAGIPAKDSDKFPTLEDIWAAQLSYWIQEDIVTAVKQANAPKAAGQVVSVETAPVKRLVRVTIPKEYITKSGPLPIGAGGGYAPMGGGTPLPSGGTSRFGTPLPGSDVGAAPVEETNPGAPLPKVFTSSFTGRVCNPLFDVMHFTVVVDVDARHYQSFMSSLCDRKFITILEAHMVGVDLEQADQYGFVYGRDPVVQLTLKCEAVFFRDWTVGMTDAEGKKVKEGPMPMSIRKALGIGAAGAGGSVAGL